MVGNAEPGKEYNYRPLSKLCECQLDVNDQVSTKGPEEGGLERERAELRQLQTDGQERQTDGKSERQGQQPGRPSWRGVLELPEPGVFKALTEGRC